MNTGPSRLEQAEDHYETAVGAMFPGERAVFRGHDLHSQMKNWGWLELYFYGVSGRRLSVDDMKILNALFVYTSYPDPRIWLNRIAALAGTARSTGALGLSGAISAAEAAILGPRTNLRAIHFIQKTLKQVESGEPLEELLLVELKKNRLIPGFGRPIVAGEDERIAPTMALLAEYQRHKEPHVALLGEIQRILKEKKLRLWTNFAGLTAAIGADMGLAPREFYMGSLLSFCAGMIPCLVDALDHDEGTFFPMRCTRIDYKGCEGRSWT